MSRPASVRSEIETWIFWLARKLDALPHRHEPNPACQYPLRRFASLPEPAGMGCAINLDSNSPGKANGKATDGRVAFRLYQVLAQLSLEPAPGQMQ